MLADEIRRVIEESPLAVNVERAMAQVRPAVRMRSYLVEVGDLAPGVSRIGGAPDLPPDVPWPERNRRPLDFLAQIDLAEAARAYALPGLPVTGWLTVFYDLKARYDQTAWDVVHFGSEPRLLVRREHPDRSAHRLNFCELQLEREDCLPDLSELVSDDFPDDDYAWDALEKLEERINEADGQQPVHRLGGHPMLIQSAASDHSLGWDFLLQIDSDFELGWMWGDMGRLYFWNKRPSALARVLPGRRRKFGPTWCGEEFY